MEILCPKCGLANPPDAWQCSCGQTLPLLPDPAPSQVEAVQPAPAASQPGDGPPSLAGELQKLRSLHEAGALNDQEFAAAKGALLSPPKPLPPAPVPAAPPPMTVPTVSRTTPPVMKTNNTAAVIGFCLGIASAIFYVIGILPILALVVSVIGLATFDEKRHKNKWMAFVGLGLGIVYTLMMLNHYGHLR